MNMKRLMSLLLAVLLVVSLVGCGSGIDRNGTESTDDGSGTTEETGGSSQIVIGSSMTYTSLDPAHSYEYDGDMVLRAAYDTLVKSDLENETQVIPGVAEDWTISDDGLTYVFNIRQDLTFTTGKGLTAEDCAYCLRRAKGVMGSPAFLLDTVETIEATGDYELTLTLNTPNPAMLSILTRASFGIYDSEVAQANGGTCDENDTFQSYVDQNPSLGTGAYQISSYTSGSEVVLDKNPDSVLSTANVDRIIIRNIADASTQQMELEGGDIDFALDLTADQTALLADNEDLQLITSKTYNIFFLMLNASEEYGKELANPTVREAIKYAIDYDGLCSLAGNGAFTPAGIIPEGFLGYMGESTVERDVERAKELLAEADYPDGFTFDCGVIPDMAPDGVSFMTCAQKIQSDLAEVGITMNIVSQQASVYLEEYRNGTQQAVISQWGPDYYDPNNQLAFLPGNSVGLRAGWPAEACPELAELGSEAAVTLDDATREELFHEIQTTMDEVNSPFIVFLQAGRTWAVSNRVQNIIPSAAYMLDLATLQVAE